MTSLEGWSSTIELHPQQRSESAYLPYSVEAFQRFWGLNYPAYLWRPAPVGGYIFLRQTGGSRAMGESRTKTQILLVEDDVLVRRLLRLVCEVEGIDIVGEADNGVDGVITALQTRPDIVILDFQMPELDGRGVARILHVALPDTRVIAFSAFFDDKPEWADGFVSKDDVSKVVPLVERLSVEPKQSFL